VADDLARTIPRLLQVSAAKYGSRIAVADGDVRLTFTELRVLAERAARGFLAAGIRPGDRVGIWAPNSATWIACSLGAQTAGAVVVPINTRYRAFEARELLARTDAAVLVVADGFLGYDYIAALGRTEEDAEEDAEGDAALLKVSVTHIVNLCDGQPTAGTALGAPVLSWPQFLDAGAGVSQSAVADASAAVAPDDLAEIIFTSGTTGRPKGVMLTHGATLDLYRSFGAIWGLRPGDRFLLSLPFFHTGGLKGGLINSLIHGATVIPFPVFDPLHAMQVIERERVTVMMGPPTVFATILDHPQRSEFDLASLRLASTGAAVVPQSLVERARAELPFENFITAYGLTECCGSATMCRPADPARVVAATNGTALPGVEVKVADPDGAGLAPGEPGEVLVRGSNVTPGYWRDPDATAAAIDADGWLHTGDVGHLDAEGHLTITDRLKDLFIVGGFNVSPAEVEQVLARHPEISEVTVIGVPDDRLGEVARAYVIPRPGTSPAGEAIITWCRERLANFKVPRTVEFVTALPRNASGKVLKHELRHAATEAQPLAGVPAPEAPA
jgi:acyl-CoA synthetase (AMP-forming)/AMP-acid ligase II